MNKHQRKVVKKLRDLGYEVEYEAANRRGHDALMYKGRKYSFSGTPTASWQQIAKVIDRLFRRSDENNE
jgi:hypothetical protein